MFSRNFEKNGIREKEQKIKVGIKFVFDKYIISSSVGALQESCVTINYAIICGIARV